MLRPHPHEIQVGPRPRIRQALVLLACLISSAYFGFHALHGRHGLDARSQLVERSTLLDFEIKSLEAVRTKLERDVALLSPDKPDPDIVEEIARDVLGYVRPDDVLVPERP
ncbi:MAG TPA: septum formation initiator family protein [Hyphomicrobium sp.]|nr:septum formation initiator family protein [Hyphomicrobium sp.]